MHGLARALVNNAVEGVTKGWTRELEIVGIGYRAEMKGKGMVVFNLGYSHPIEYPLPTGVDAGSRSEADHADGDAVSIARRSGRSPPKCASLRPPDPYKNKGVRYAESAEEEGWKDRSEISVGSELELVTSERSGLMSG